ncbi:phytanoyl-CoA dioxygenase domain-containing protein 1 [Chrysoperla carnea]|uniref:phytanoyl-CoA dioxygenase domain-containing protein 1 n=1 Tax=Chrysoperla carnea TaxID=189513 RepID=UPI001D06C69A|nr:phytanoyl-CoA dioxygenase domain-containing protein 1 [Chrysoperla carnea]
MHDILSHYRNDGYAIIEDFFSASEVEELRHAGEEFTKNLPDESERTIFSTTKSEQASKNYFLESADKVRIFFEADALDENGKLKCDSSLALNKVGHALHYLHPVFRKYSFDERIKEICFQLGYQDPVIPQSMYIYKNPGVGSEVKSHQDASYLYTEPLALTGFWFALDDATLENGCLWMIPGSHNGGVHRRFIRNPDKESKELLVYDRSEPIYQKSAFVPVPVKKGSCVLIDGLVVHRSENNKSNLPRHAYTLHVIEQQNTVYSPDNWLQPTNDYSFPSLYRNN